MAHFGLIGLGVMGQNLARNVARNGFDVVVYNRTTEKTDQFIETYPDVRITATYSIEELSDTLERPRRIMLMVSAGRAVDLVIDALEPYLDPDDVVIDGGNSHYRDTNRRADALAEVGIHFLGTGISGGEEGALWGPSIMPGGPREAYDAVAPMLEAIAAKAEDGAPCVAYLGPRGSGHYVKMVHNGIEYAIMQAIAETYDLLQRAGGLGPQALADVFAEWNRAELSSFLVEITAKIFTVVDETTGRPLIDLILDKAKQKGTGKWTSQDAFDVGVPVPAITAAVEGRILSAFKEQRGHAARLLSGPTPDIEASEALIEPAREALYATMVVAYAQGLALLRGAATEYEFGYDLADVASIWRAGCIIRAALLEEIRAAYSNSPDLTNLLIADSFRESLAERQQGWRTTVTHAIQNGIPMPVMSTALAYYDGYRSERLPANLIQAQRDFFGAHTYERIDAEGTFHTDWTAIT